jgi:hypothetical protein
VQEARRTCGRPRVERSPTLAVGCGGRARPRSGSRPSNVLRRTARRIIVTALNSDLTKRNRGAPCAMSGESAGRPSAGVAPMRVRSCARGGEQDQRRKEGRGGGRSPARAVARRASLRSRRVPSVHVIAVAKCRIETPVLDAKWAIEKRRLQAPSRTAGAPDDCVRLQTHRQPGRLLATPPPPLPRTTLLPPPGRIARAARARGTLESEPAE